MVNSEWATTDKRCSYYSPFTIHHSLAARNVCKRFNYDVIITWQQGSHVEQEGVFADAAKDRRVMRSKRSVEAIGRDWAANLHRK